MKSYAYKLRIKLTKELFQRLFVYALSIFILLGISLGLTTKAQAETTITNTATAVYSINGTAKTKTASVQFTKGSTPPTLVPLQLLKKSHQKIANIGDTVSFTLTIRNTNSVSVANISIQDQLPTGLEYKPDSAHLNNIQQDISVINHEQLIFPLGDIPAKTQWTLTYEATITHAVISSPLINRAQIVTDNKALNSSVSQASIGILSGNPLGGTILISKNSNRKSANAGDVITYTAVIENPSAQRNLAHLLVYDTLPAGLAYIAGSATVDGITLKTNQVIINRQSLQFSLGTLGKTKKTTLSYQVSVTDKAIGTTTINRIEAASDNALSEQATAIVKIRTPSTVEFLKITNKGTKSTILPSSFNSGRDGLDSWQHIKSIILSDGRTVALPSQQSLIKAEQYSISDPIVVRVTDKDQNTDPTRQETILITLTIPETGDQEILRLTETSINSGIFLGAIQTTITSSKRSNGRLSLEDGSKIRVNYRDAEDSTDVSATAAIAIPKTKWILTKSADKQSTTIGELVRYTLSFDNPFTTSLADVQLQDTLPSGFDYVKGSAQLNHTRLQNAVISQGRLLTFNLGTIPPHGEWKLEYVTKVSVGVKTGQAINKARLFAPHLQSNLAKATVTVNDDLMRSRNILTGRVIIGCDSDPNITGTTNTRSTPLKNARLYLETGRSVITDDQGFWHMEGIQPGSHVVQLDTETLPDGYSPLLCKDSTRHAGDAQSRFVDLKAGSLWRVDFHVQRTTDSQTDSQTTINAEKSIQNSKGFYKEPNPFLLYDDQYLSHANDDFEIIWPNNNYVPTVASTQIIIKSSTKYNVEVFLNGEPVSPLNYDGSDTNKAKTVVIRRWKGVDINVKRRDNTLLAILKDKSGKEISRQSHNIHFSGNPATAELLPDKSVLVADGKTTPVVSLLIRDEDGFPMRANTHGYYKLENSHYQPKTLIEDKDSPNLNDSFSGSYKYLIGEGGIARIEFNPTSQSGELKITPQFNYQSDQYNAASTSSNDLKLKHNKAISVWLKPHLRNWILVGIAEGTIGYQTLSGNLQSLDNTTDKLYKRGRMAFFAKGRIKGKYLLTLAYDTHKQKQEVGSQLGGTIDPDAWYTIYADNSSSQYDAPSSRKLYVKIEKDNFYALFGDFHTGLTITELARYERILNGFKTEYQGGKYNYKGFISQTSNQHQHQEIPGDGTSGLYYLNGRVIPNSETIRIETRDRFHSDRILQSKNLIRHQDYEIDYDAGSLFFKSPITGRDAELNPNIIIIDYDNEDPQSNKSITMGGRVAVKTFGKKVEVGLSLLNKGRNRGRDDRLIATDINYQIDTNTKLHVEAAQSQTKQGHYGTKHAYMAELEKEIENLEARLYYKKQDGHYGLDSQTSEGGTRKAGVEIRYQVNAETHINAEVSHQKNLAANNQRQLAKVGVEHHHQQYEINAGARHTRELISGETHNNNALLLGGRYTSKTGKISLRSTIEKNISSGKGSELSPDRAIVGVDIRLNHGFTLFAEHETTDNTTETTHNNRIGISKQLWQGADAKTTYTQERSYQGQRNYATLGLSQTFNLTEKIRADFSIDQAKTLSDTRIEKRFNTNEPSRQGTQRDDYTAFSVGLGSNQKDWSWTSRAELRKGDINDKANFRFGVIRYMEDGKNLSATLDYSQTESDRNSFSNHTTISLGSAWHPVDANYTFLNRLDWVNEKNNYDSTLANSFNSFNSSNPVDTNHNESSGLENHIQKFIHNMHYNRQINDKTQFNLHHGIKHIKENNKAVSHSSTIDTTSIEVRHDISKRWDMGLHAGYLHDWKSKTVETLAGFSVGVTPAENAWISLGYNYKGFDDRDFDKSDYKRKGIYMNIRYKFNQNSFNGDIPLSRLESKAGKPLETEKMRTKQKIIKKQAETSELKQKTMISREDNLKQSDKQLTSNPPVQAIIKPKKYETLESVWQ